MRPKRGYETLALLKALIGFKNTKLIQNKFGGKEIYIPKYNHAEDILTEVRISDVSRAAKRFKVSRRWVFELLRRERERYKLEGEDNGNL